MHRVKPCLPKLSFSSVAGVAALVASLALAAAPAEAARRKPRAVRGANLQAVLDAALPGDVIVVRGVVKGTVRGDEAGEIHIWTPGITIDARRATFRARVIVRAEDVRIEGARFRDARLLAFGDRIEVVGARVVRGTLSVTGTGVVADGNRLDGRGVTSQALEIAGDHARVTENDVRSFVSPVLATGDRLDVSGNRIRWSSGTALRLVGDGSSASGNAISESARGIDATGDDVTLSTNDITSVETSGLAVDGARARIEGNTVAGVPGGAAITLGGSGGVAEENVVRAARTAVEVRGAGMSVLRNDLMSTDRATVILSASADALVESNVIAGGAAGAVFVEGDRATIRGNDVTSADGDALVAVVGGGAVIVGNTLRVPAIGPLRGGATDGIAVFGAGADVSENDVSGGLNDGAAVRVQGGAATVSGNMLHDLVLGDGIVLTGGGGLAEGNVVRRVTGEGVVLSGAGNVVRTTTVSGATACAFLIFDAAVIDACTVTDCTMGIVNLADGTEITGSLITGNGTGAANLDVIDLGSVVIGEGTTVGHLIIDAAAFPEFVDLQTTGYRPLETPSALR